MLIICGFKIVQISKLDNILTLPQIFKYTLIKSNIQCKYMNFKTIKQCKILISYGLFCMTQLESLCLRVLLFNRLKVSKELSNYEPKRIL